MKYLIIGTGGIGGAIGGFLSSAGIETTMIARGKQLHALKEKGLIVHSVRNGEINIFPVKAFSAEEYNEIPDVVFVCVKGYSIEEILPFLQKICGEKTVIIPLLNILGTGKKIAQKLPGKMVTDGCIYIVSYVNNPGEIVQSSPIVPVVYGMRDGSKPPILEKVKRDLEHSGVDVLISDQIQRDCFQKFSCVSPMAAAGSYFNTNMGEIRSNQEKRNFFIKLVEEISSLADAMGIPFKQDAVAENLNILDGLSPDTTASLQKDLKRGGNSEIDGILFEPVRLGKKYGVAVPCYEKVAEKFGFDEI